MSALLIAGVALLLVAGATLGALLFVVGRRIALPRASKLVPIEVRGDVLTAPAGPVTTLSGEFGLWVNDGKGHIRVGALLGESEGSVRRSILAVHGSVFGASEARWTGHVFPTPEATGVRSENVLLPTGRSAWLFPGAPDRWVIHVHGVHSARASALRGVPVASRLGYTSLVPQFYGESEADCASNEGATFGVREMPDVGAAIQYALINGARSVVLIGWSMGAEISIRLANEPRYRGVVEGVVAIGPALSWRSSIRRAMDRSHLPQFLANMVLRSLERPTFSRAMKMEVPANFGLVEWVTPPRANTVPTLVIHSPGDTHASYMDSSVFAAHNPHTVTLIKCPPVPHLLEWNNDIDGVESAIASWIRQELTH